MTTLKILTFCFTWRHSDPDGVSAELGYLAFSGQRALPKIRVDLHCCSEMASTDLIGYIIGFANDTNWARFRHLRVLEVKTDIFLGMKDGPKEPQRAIFIKDPPNGNPRQLYRTIKPNWSTSCGQFVNQNPFLRCVLGYLSYQVSFSFAFMLD